MIATLTRPLETRAQRVRNLIFTVLAIFVLLAITGGLAYLSMFVGFYTSTCGEGADCNPFLTTFGWLGGLFLPAALSVITIISAFVLIRRGRASTLLVVLAVVAVALVWLIFTLLFQIGVPSFNIGALLPV